MEASARKHRWQTVLVCIFGAMVFWRLNALNKVYTTDMNYPVAFIIDESKVAFTKVPPSTIRLEVTGGGWSLLRYLLSLHVQPIELPVAQVSKRGNIKSEYLWPIFNKRLKDLKVRSVLMDEALCVHTLLPKPPTG
jgi:hypothetical protein